MRKLRIGLQLFGTHTFDLSRPGNIQGDEAVAIGWHKYLLQRPDVETVRLYDRLSQVEPRLDVLIHFYPFLPPHSRAKNVLYLQNAFPRDQYPGGTAGVFQQVRDRFDGYLFTSGALMQACAPGAVVPFATDPEILAPTFDPGFEYPVAFVGNDIRGPIVNQRFFTPALPFGLVIYGNNTWAQPWAAAARGKLAAADMPRLYSSARINLNAHIEEHVTWDTINLRIYDILACEGFVLSDAVASLAPTFGEAVVTTTGDEDEWAKLVRFLADPAERRRRGQLGRQIVLSGHTYAQRVAVVVEYLAGLL